jgi:hypothetical protein
MLGHLKPGDELVKQIVSDIFGLCRAARDETAFRPNRQTSFRAKDAMTALRFGSPYHEKPAKT